MESYPACLVVQPSRLHMQAGRLRYKDDDRNVRYPAVLVTCSVSSTVDTSQSASPAIFHSYLSESRGGPGPTWLSEGTAVSDRGRMRTETEMGQGVYNASAHRRNHD